VAFGRSELRLILGVQAYGTSNLARLRRDITSLGRTVDLANANQSRVAAEAVRSMEKGETLRRSIAAREASIARRTTAAQDARTAGLAKAERTRGRLITRGQQLEAQAAAKRMQIANTEAAITKGTTGSAALRNQVSRMGLENQTMRIADRRISLAEKELGLQRSIRNTRARTIDLERQLGKLGANDAQISRWRQANANLGNMGARLRPIVLRLQAADINAAKLQSELVGLADEARILDAETAKLNLNEQKVLATINEQVGAMGRLDELLKVQNTQLAAIEARESAIAGELRLIQAEEGRINGLHASRIAELHVERELLEGEKLALVEQEAILQRLLGQEMARAAAMDKQAVAAERAMKREVAGRTLAHGGRAAQFTGLIGTAVFAATANAAADMSRKTALAGTQMRDVGGSFQQAAVRGRELQQVILHMMERFPADAAEMSDSAYEIFSSMNLVRDGVVDVTKGYQLMATANKVAVAGQVDLEEATSAMIVTLNNFNPALRNVHGTMNQVFAIVRFGQMRLSDFAAAMVPLAPVAKTAGLGLEDVGAALASLTILFKSPQQAAQGLARAIELFQLAPFEQGFHKLGIEVYDAGHKMRPLHDILTDISKRFPEVATGQRSIINLLTSVSKASGLTKAGIQGTVQARRALGGLLTTMQLYDNILKNIHGDQNEFNDAFDAMKDTPGVQWAIFVNQMKAFALTVGQAALPVMLRVGQWLVNAAHWIEDMIKRTDGAAVKWAAFGSVLLLVGGTLLNIAGSLIALTANLRLATMSFGAMGGSAAKAGIAVRLLGAGLSVLAGIGVISIPIVMQLVKGGEPGLWDFLGAALAGAAGGAMIGSAIAPGVGTAIGAAAGGIVLPITVKIISELQKPETNKVAKDAHKLFMKQLRDAGSRREEDAVSRRWGLDPNGNFFKLEDFEKAWRASLKKFKVPTIGEDVAGRPGGPRGKNIKKSKTLLDQYQDYVKQFTKAQLDAQNTYLDSLSAGDTKGDRAASLAKKHAQIVSDAFKQMQQEVEQDVDKLGGVYDKFLQMNQAAFGEVFQGPVLSGFMGQIFSSINDLLMQFGQSIPVPIQIIQNDLDVQMKNFAKLRDGYAALVKKGVPPEVVSQIQQMGMAGLPFIQGLLNASGPQFQKWLASMKKSHGDIVKATEIDFDAQLAQWKKYGSDIATKMIDGLSSDAAQATIKGGFDKYVMQVFGKTLRDNMAKTIATNMQAAMEEAAAANAAKDKEKGLTKAQIKAAREAATKALAGGPKGKPQPTVVDKAGKAGTTAATRQFPGSGGISPGGTMPKTFGGFVSTLPSSAITQPHTVVNNQGDSIVIHADGVHPNNLTRAMNKSAFKNRNKRRGR